MCIFRRYIDLINNKTLLSELEENFDKYAPILLNYERNTERSYTISHAIRKFYLEDKHLGNSTLAGLAQMIADGITGFAVNRAVKLLSVKNSKPVYYYHFTHQGRYSHYYLPGSNKVPFGVVHHDDLIYLFYISALFPKFTETDPESRTVDKMIKLYANFAKTGNPIPEPSDIFNNVIWQPFTIKNNTYLDIGQTLEMNTGLHAKRYKIWEDVIPLPDVS